MQLSPEADGHFELSGLPEGDYLVRTSLEDTQTEEGFSIHAGQTTTVTMAAPK